MTIGNTNYIPSHIPLSSIPTPSNSFLTTLPPPHSCGPSGWNVATSHVHTTTTRIVVSQSQVPPVVLGGHIPTSGTSYGLSEGVSHIPTYGISLGHLMGHLMEPLMDNIMDHSMDRVIHLVGTGIKNPLTPRIMAL